MQVSSDLILPSNQAQVPIICAPCLEVDNENKKKHLLEGFLLAKHTSHKHPHHDGAVCLSSGMVSMDEHTPPSGVSSEGVGRGLH
jgi:hypothetical protein